MTKLLTAAHRKLFIEFMKFGTVGVFGFVIDTSLVYFGYDILGLSKVMAAYFSFPFTVTFTWIGNRLFTYRHKKHESIGAQWAKFLVVCAFGLVFNRGTYTLLVLHVPIVSDHIIMGIVGGTAVGMFFNFFAVRLLVFK